MSDWLSYIMDQRVTSNIDWCEDNWTLTPWIAEFGNSISNILGVLLGLYGLSRSKQLGWPRTFQLSNFLMISVYLGSTLFHATLKYEFQLLDELPMILGSCWLHFSLNKKDWPLISLFGAIIIGLMMAFPDSPLPLQLGYVGFLIPLWIRSIIDVQSFDYKSDLPGKYLRYGLGIYLTGGILWIIDMHFCESVQHLFFHSLWHIFTAIGSHLYISYTVLSHCLKKPGVTASSAPCVFGIPMAQIIWPLKTIEIEKPHIVDTQDQDQTEKSPHFKKSKTNLISKDDLKNGKSE